MKLVIREFNGGLNITPNKLVEEIQKVIVSIDEKMGIRKAPMIRSRIQAGLLHYGWSGEIEVDPTSRISITSCKMNIGLCIQTGNYARVYADLLKLQTMHVKGLINGGVIILPTIEAARILATNMANMDRLGNELDIFEQVINLPLLLFGFYD